MDTQKAIELLPWYLNGTLPENERREVEEHLANSQECRDALDEARALGEIFKARLPTDVLVAHAFGGETGEFATETIEAHLAASPADAELFELVMQSKGALEWSERADAKRAPAAPAPATARSATGRVQRWRVASIAASLAFVVTLGGWLTTASRVGTLQARLDASAPTQTADGALAHAGGTFLDLAPMRIERGTETPGQEFPRLMRGAFGAYLSLELPREPDGSPSYVPEAAKLLELVSADGTVLHRVPGTPPQDSSYYPFFLPSTNLDPGVYRVLLFEADSVGGEPLATYPLEVTES